MPWTPFEKFPDLKPLELSMKFIEVVRPAETPGQSKVSRVHVVTTGVCLAVLGGAMDRAVASPFHVLPKFFP